MLENPAQKKISLISLGCPKNLVDAELMLGSLQKEGFSFSANPEEADVIVVNTCGFVEDSKKESIEELLRMAEYKKNGKCQTLVATGCLSQRYGNELSQDLPEVDLFVGLGEFDRLPALLKNQSKTSNRVVVNEQKEKPLKDNLSEFTTHRQILPDPDHPRILATPKHYSYVKISEGCSHRCSFCVIPHIRGDLKSRPISSIVNEVEDFANLGVKEFNLIAQDLNEYGKDLRDGSSLTDLLQKLDQVSGDFWIRLLYLYPLEFTDRLIETLQKSKHVIPYIDMPLQHIHDRILRSMKRGSPGRYVKQVLGKLKTAMPNVTLRTTFIVGYPGETKEEFQALYDFVGETEFDRVGVFQYSPEEGTPAALLENQVPEEIKAERFHQLMSLQQKISEQKNQKLLGQDFQALIEKKSSERPGFYEARLQSQAPEIDGITYVQGENIDLGSFQTVQIIGAEEYDLVAE